MLFSIDVTMLFCGVRRRRAGDRLQTTSGCFANFLDVARAVVEDALRATMAAML